MPFINAAMNEAVEAEVVPEGEYHIRNHEAEMATSKKGSQMIKVLSVIESPDYPNAAPIMTYLALPGDDDEPKSAAFKLLQLRRFCECFEIPFEENGFDTDDIAGSEGDCLVKQETFQPLLPDGSPDTSKEPFTSNKLALPRLRTEPEEEEEEKPAPKKAPAKAAGRRR